MGFLAAAPFLVKSLSGPIGGITADLLRRRHLSTQAVRQLYYAIGKLHASEAHLQKYMTRKRLLSA